MSKVRSAALTTFFALFLLTLSLGIWQINRGYEKRELENTFSFQQSYPVEEITYNLDSKINLYRNISIRGRFLQNLFYLDNKIYDGKPGVVVLSPFELEDGSAIIVSRGWVEMQDRQNFMKIEKLIEKDIKKIPLPNGFEKGPIYKFNKKGKKRKFWKKNK